LDNLIHLAKFAIHSHITVSQTLTNVNMRIVCKFKTSQMKDKSNNVSLFKLKFKNMLYIYI